jgi:hypothetical protein
MKEMNYSSEIKSETLKGIVTLGSREGYDCKCEISLEQMLRFIHEANVEVQTADLPSIPCIVREGILIGRASETNYQEKVYSLEYLWSPRSKTLPKEQFYNTLIAYADCLGKKTKQNRVYVEFEGMTEILRHK